jgi:hypothetical protein
VEKDPAMQFDLVFTSPPFFNLERYSNEATQSSSRYPKYEDWKQKFLFEMVTTSFNKLRPEGFFAIHLKNCQKHPICDDMNRFIAENVKYARFVGAIGHETKRYAKKGIEGVLADPIWIYQKI